MFNGTAFNVAAFNAGVVASPRTTPHAHSLGLFVDRSDLYRPWFSIPRAGRYDITFIPGRVITIKPTSLLSGISPGTGGARFVTYIDSGLWRLTHKSPASTPVLSRIH